MPQENLSPVFKISINVVFEAVGMVQIKKIYLLQKLLAQGVQLAVWNRFFKSSSLRLIRSALVHMIIKWYLMVVQRMVRTT